MKVEVAPSFIESLKNIDSLKNKYYQIKAWFRYHFTKDFFKVLKSVLKSYPWQESFLYDIEKEKLNEMANYLEKENRFVGVEYVVRDIRLCIKLIDIMQNETALFHYDGDLTFKRIKNSDNYEVNHTPDFKYNCNVYVNTKNIDRFCVEKEKEFILNSPHELYLRKAKYLYHKIRYERDNQWWD